MSKSSRPTEYAALIEANARQIREMHSLIHQTVRVRGTPGGREAWQQACADFHARYDALAFPGGYESGLQRIAESEGEAVEAALVFLELRPYFFRSGYMREKLLRRLKHASMSAAQAKRFNVVQEAQRAWRAKKLAMRDVRRQPLGT